MFLKSLIVLAALSSCCYAQQTAADVASGLDSITQSLSDVMALVKDASGDEKTQTMINKYRDAVQAENDFNNANSQPPPTAFTEAEQEEICTSLKTSTSQHTSLLEAFGTQHDSIDSLYFSLISNLLRSDEQTVDQSTLQISDLVPNCKETALEGSDTLATTFSDVMAQYDTSV